MNLSVRHIGALTLGLVGLALAGCLPTGTSSLDEEKEPHFVEGKSHVTAMDYTGAIDCFEQSLEVNPKSAAAHFELALIYYQKEADPAAAIYHCEQYLKLRPGADNTDTVKQLIMNCKQELARTVSLGPVTEKQQRELEKLVEENKQLSDENKRLNEEIARWRAYFAGRGPAGPTNPQVAGSAAGTAFAAATTRQPASGLASGSPTNTGRQAPTVSGARTHTIKPGETPTMIARKYGVKLEALMAANPGLDPRRLRPGQTLSLPAP